MAFSLVGSVQTATVASSTPHVTLNATAAGDVILAVACLYNGGTLGTVTSISYSGVATWHKLVSFSVSGRDAEIWWGVVTATGSATLTINLGAANDNGDIFAAQFHSSVAGTWTADAATGTSSSTATSGTYSSQSPSETALFFAAGSQSGWTWGGSTSGFTYTNGAAGLGQFIYNTSPPSPSAPGWTLSHVDITAQVDGFLFVAPPTAGFFEVM